MFSICPWLDIKTAIFTKLFKLKPSHSHARLNTLQWRHNLSDGVSNHIVSIVYSTVCLDSDQRNHQGSATLAICEGNSPVTGEFPLQRASNVENASIWWRHHEPSEYITYPPFWYYSEAESGRSWCARCLVVAYKSRLNSALPSKTSKTKPKSWNSPVLSHAKYVHAPVRKNACE